MSYANVAATLALFFAMSGGALAAKHYLINSTKQINPKVLKALRGNRGAAGPAGAKGASGPGGATGAKGETGIPGARGEKGAPGANGATKVVVRTAEATTPNVENGEAQANCAPGERATGGGTKLAVGQVQNLWFFDTGGRPVPNTPGATPTGWYNQWFNNSGSTDTIEVYVICASP
jgi:hypothetical protein